MILIIVYFQYHEQSHRIRRDFWYTFALRRCPFRHGSFWTRSSNLHRYVDNSQYIYNAHAETYVSNLQGVSVSEIVYIFLLLHFQFDPVGDICVNVNDNVWIINKEEMDYTTLPQLIAPQTSLEYDCQQPLSFFLRKHKVDQPGMHHIYCLSRLIESIHDSRR